MKITPFICGLILLSWSSFGQCLTGSRLPDGCTDQDVALSAPGAQSIVWDFSPGDFLQQPTANSFGAFSSAVQPEKLTLVHDGTTWHGFLPGSTMMYHLEFNDALDEVTSSSVLDVYSGFGTRLTAIEFVNQGGNWYGFGTFLNGGRIVRFDFGTDLSTVDQTVNLGNFGTTGSGNSLKIVEDGDIVLVVSDGGNRKYVMVNLGTDATSTPDPVADVIEYAAVDTPVNDIEFFKQCDSWYALLVGTAATNSLTLLDYGANVFIPNPVATDLTSQINPAFTNAPTGISVIYDSGEIVALLSSLGPNVYRLNFGDDITNSPANEIISGLDPGFSQNFGVETATSNSLSRAFFVNNITRQLFSYEFPNSSSGASIDQSNDVSLSTVQYQSDGWKYITKQIIDAGGEHQYFYDSVLIQPAPTAEFSATNACSNRQVQFTDLSTGQAGPIVSWDWDFDGMGSSTDQNPTHTFVTPGDYNITLVIEEQNGCQSTLIKSIKIYDENDLTPDFSFPSLTCSNSDIAFTDQSTFTEDTPAAWLWDFGDPASGSANSSTDQHPTHIFTTSGDFDITLTVTGVSGCQKTVVNPGGSPVTIIAGPQVDFVGEDQCLGNDVVFSNLTTGNNIDSYTWDFDDGFTSNLENPTHTYLDAGTYQVTLEASNVDGCISSVSREIHIAALPAVSFINNISCAGTLTQFFDQSTVENDNIVGWEWDFGDPGSPENFSTDRNPSHQYNSEGAFNVKLITTSESGCIDSTELTVDVLPTATLDLSVINTCVGETTTFADLTVLNGVTVTSRLWVIDGQNFTATSPVFEFSTAGVYPVSLTLTFDNNCSLTYTEDITISEPPLLDFSFSNACVGDAVLFTDLTDSVNQVVANRTWDFAGLGAGNGKEVAFTFDQTGTFDVQLTVELEGGCQQSLTKSITIQQEPTSAFEPAFTTGAAPLTVNFTNMSENADSFVWNVNGNIESIESDFIFTFTDIGTSTAQLIASNGVGCVDTAEVVISVVEPSLDLELVQINQIDQDGDKKLVLTIANNGSVVIEELEIHISLDNRVPLQEPLQGIIRPFETINYQLVGEFSPELLSNLDFICVELVPMNISVADSDTNDNIKCLNLNSAVVIQGPYPNPVSDKITLEVLAKQPEPIEVTLLNTSGDLVLQQILASPVVGLNELTLEVLGFNAGLYFLRVSHDGVISTSRLFIK